MIFKSADMHSSSCRVSSSPAVSDPIERAIHEVRASVVPRAANPRVVQPGARPTSLVWSRRHRKWARSKRVFYGLLA